MTFFSLSILLYILFSYSIELNFIQAEKARQRFQVPAQDKPGTSRSNESHSPLAHQVAALLNLCMNHISQRLNDPVHQIRSLSGVAEDLAQKLLDYLLKNRLLKPKTLNAFIPW